MVDSLKRFEFRSNPLLSISIELPHSTRTSIATHTTKAGIAIRATHELIYQQPSDITKASLAKTEIEQLLEASVNQWKEKIGSYTHENLQALVDIDAPLKLVDPPRSIRVLVLQRSRIDSVTKSITERFTDEFNKQYPQSLPIEMAVSVLGGLPIVFARRLLRSASINSLAIQQTGTDFDITHQTHNQYQDTMRWGTWGVGFIAAIIALVGADVYEGHIWRSRGSKGHCGLIAGLLFGIPYACFINMITKNEAQHRYHACKHRLC